MKVHKFEIRSRRADDEDNPDVGASTQFLVDGKPMKGVTKVTYEVEAGAMAKMTIEVVGRFSVEDENLEKVFVVEKKRSGWANWLGFFSKQAS